MLEHVDNRGEVTLVTQEEGGGQDQEEAEGGHHEAGGDRCTGPGSLASPHL